MGGEAGEGMGSCGCSRWWNRKTQYLGHFCPRLDSGTSSEQLSLLLVVTEQVLAHMHDSETRVPVSAATRVLGQF